ncbi:hypothetical protein BCR44DRAFT_264126 [Catenaria anguillulae PL171]|uniref:Protein kinase domain-containing protein n=1 Tax=Catenaria anguillulae PL171 TaxID=765915 RepID=A0A1Y2HY36_9FUNG|nr:hypothetical protein BCR44DRAFT_264126 [Catenaria anguillulae PL171]
MNVLWTALKIMICIFVLGGVSALSLNWASTSMLSRDLAKARKSAVPVAHLSVQSCTYLHRGGYGSVSHAVDRISGKIVALKIVSKKIARVPPRHPTGTEPVEFALMRRC